jgi:hypothetical protein
VVGYWEEGNKVAAGDDGGLVVSNRLVDAGVVSCRGRGREAGREDWVFAGDADDGEERGDKNAGDPMVDRGVG